MLEELKNHLKITWTEEDADLIDLLLRGKKALERMLGVKINYEEDKDIKELLFNWCRYSRNNALEYFQTNFLNEINTIAFSLAIKERKGDLDE